MEGVTTNNAQVVALAAHGFSFAYPHAETLIGPLEWQVERGAFQLLVGATGSGKTTLLRCLKPAIAPVGTRAGQLEVFGTPVESMNAHEAAVLVGYVAQSPENQLVCDSVWHELAFGLENLGIPQAEMRRRVAEVAHFFGIEPWFRRPVAELSGGQKQMLTLASVLAMQPQLLLLDEPTAQLDPVAEKNFLHALFRVNRELGITVIVATHAPETMIDYATDLVELQTSLTRVDPEVKKPAPLSSGAIKDAREACETQPPITLRDVYLRYSRESDWVLRGFEGEVSTGSIHALVGGNGCGKSTLLRVIAGVLQPERGRIANQLASRQALLPQTPKALFVCDSVRDELGEWQDTCGYPDAAIEKALERFDLAAHADNHPYDLSGGQQQKLALAKLLLTDPELLLLDEPTKGLDARSKCMVAEEVLARKQAGVTIVLATHDLAFAALVSDEATMLFDGEAACNQPTNRFFANNLFYRPMEDAFVRLWLGDTR